MDANDTDFGRRDFLRTLAVVGVTAGALSMEATPADAASCPKFPKAKKSKEIVPVRIQSEIGDDISGQMDLRTVERGTPLTLSCELFFDTYEEGKSVREITDKIETLVLVDQDIHRPPTALLTWGTGLAFKCTFESAQSAFSLFLADGTPVRAVMLTRLLLDPDDCTLGAGTP